MRNTVDAILNHEATRLLDKARMQGLTKDDLSYLDKLINTYTTFVGSPSPEPGSEAAVDPTAQSTADLLAAVGNSAPQVSPVPVSPPPSEATCPNPPVSTP